MEVIQTLLERANKAERAMNQEKVWQQFTGLPPNQQQEVLDFMAFLQTRGTSPTSRKASKRKSLAGEPFIGLWRDRKDLLVCVDWVRKTRRQEWKDPRG